MSRLCGRPGVPGLSGTGRRPIADDWNGDGTDEVGLYTPSTGTFALRLADGTTRSIRYGDPYWEPLSGDWNGNKTSSQGIIRY
ncbi:hypothetical protein [Streptomyces sp. SID13031]|uniref:hypothetical protein n=1 Tax=Streptomyces sp. SID13031 TaxID=2706046 RepID=UPI0013C55446|nr:hypothetical protein [Streptomyces sp. SID13031]NEA35680.1 hypothetical protein [Streptomyces sp. SID13031]